MDNNFMMFQRVASAQVSLAEKLKMKSGVDVVADNPNQLVWLAEQLLRCGIPAKWHSLSELNQITSFSSNLNRVVLIVDVDDSSIAELANLRSAVIMAFGEKPIALISSEVKERPEAEFFLRYFDAVATLGLGDQSLDYLFRRLLSLSLFGAPRHWSVMSSREMHA